jgi:hypothetical protein
MKVKYVVVLLGLIYLPLSIYGQTFELIKDDYCTKIVAAVYQIEGAGRTKYPYGVRSIDTKGDVDKARRICANTVRNQFIRWQKWGKTNDFLISLADRYCPSACDRTGNINWKKNIVKLVK